MRLELQIFVLLLLSVGVLSFNYFSPRTEMVEYGTDEWEFFTSYGGEGALGSSKISERGAETRVKLADQGDNSFVATVFSRGAKSPIDFGWFSKVRLKAYIVGKDQEFYRIFLRSRIPELYDPDVSESRQYNEITFKLTDKSQDFVFDRERFYVPNWWSEVYGTDPRHSIPAFDCVDAIEISSGSSVREASQTLVVEEIELIGSWISPILLYRALLASWLLLGLGVMVKTFSQYRKTLQQSEARETRLRKINSSLQSQTTQLAKMAHYDAVTGLLNRYGVRNDPRIASDQLKESGLTSLIVFDIDHFKSINDTRGHNFGDQVLADIGTVLSETCEQNQLVARWGGEEFIVVCFGVGEFEACEVAELIRKTVETIIGVTCSFGVSEIMADEPFVDALDRSDRAMYEAKSNGRNQVVSSRDILKTGNCEPVSGKVAALAAANGVRYRGLP